MIMLITALKSAGALWPAVAPLSIGLAGGDLELGAAVLAVLVLLQLAVELRRHLRPSRRRPHKVICLKDEAGRGL